MDNKKFDGTAFVKKWEKLKGDRSTWEPHWKDVSEFCVPLKDNIYGGAVNGEKKHNLLFDSVGVNACETLASALHSMLTNPSLVWFSLSTGNPKVDNVKSVREWYQDTTKKMISVMNNSNFQPEIHEVFLDLSGFGTSHLRVEEDEKDVVRFQSRPIYEMGVAENALGVIDTNYHEYNLTYEQLVELYGDMLPERIKKEAKDNPLKEEPILHSVEPMHKIPAHFQQPHLEFASVHVLLREKLILKVKGFHENPCIVTRFSKISSEKYGRAPAMRALPDIKMVNAMKKALIEAAQLKVTPPLQVPDDGVLLPIRTKPNSINYYRAGTKDRIEPLNIGGDLALGEQLIELIHKDIEKAFFIDQLKTVENDRMTATEIIQRRDEQMRIMSPILGRLQTELLKPLIQRVFGIMSRRGLIAPIPQEIAKSKLEIKYISQLAKVQDSLEAESFVRAYNIIQQAAATQPDLLDNINGDEVVKFAMLTYGAPVALLRDEAEVKKIRDARAKNQAQMQQSQMENAQADTMMKMSKAGE